MYTVHFPLRDTFAESVEPLYKYSSTSSTVTVCRPNDSMLQILLGTEHFRQRAGAYFTGEETNCWSTQKHKPRKT